MEISILRRSTAANSIVSGGIWPKLELIQSFMHVFFTCTCKNEGGSIKNEGTRVATTYFPLLVCRSFKDAQGQLIPHFMVRDFMVIHTTCMSEEDPIKNEGADVATTLYTSNFQTLKGS